MRAEPQIIETVAHHLDVPAANVTVSHPTEWSHGSFNTCVPISISGTEDKSIPTKVLLRLVSPYKNSAEYSLDGTNEKLRCEAATYIWMREHTPEIPIPELYGVGLPGGLSVWVHMELKCAFVLTLSR